MYVVGLDTETERFGPARMAPPLVVTGTYDGTAAPELHHVMDGPDVVEYLFEVAAKGEALLVGHHMAYDVGVLLAEWPWLAELIFAAYDADAISDTMIRQKLLDIANGCYRGWTSAVDGKRIKYNYYLEDLALRHLKRQMQKDCNWRTRYSELKSIPVADWPQDAIDYAAADPQATRDVWQVQEHEAQQSPGIFQDEPRQVRAALALHLASVWGIRTDKDGVLALQKTTQETADSLSDLLIKEGLLRRNGSRCVKLAKERMGKVHPDGPKTPTKQPKIDEEACLESGDEVLITFSRYGQAQNVLAKDVKALARGVSVPIHTRFDSLMETGRTSSSGEYQLQNVRRKPGVRECFVPRLGYLLAACDFDKAELHTLAQVCLKVLGHSRLAERLNAGFDPHLDLGSQILEISYEDALEFKGDPEVRKARQSAKPGNFGFPAGMGIWGFLSYAKSQYGMSFEYAAAERLREHWLVTWPEMPEYFAWIKSLCGPADVASITHLFSGRRRGLIPYTVCCNTFFQGLCADGAKAAMWEVCKREYASPVSPLYNCRTVNFVHDELIVEVPENQAHEAAMELQEVMVAAFNPWVPDVPVKASVALMHRWSKLAEPVWKDGRLVPWKETV